MKAKRLFVAIELPPEVKTELETVQAHLKKSRCVEGKYPKPEHMHLTLKFLGNVEETKIPLVTEKLQKVALPKLTLTLNGLGRFPLKGRHTHVVWASVIGEGLNELASNVEQALCEVAAPAEHPYHAHLTLVRVTHCSDEAKLAGVLARTKVATISFEVNAIALFESQLGPGVPKHRELGRVLFSTG